jgi:hypothetical protein
MDPFDREFARKELEHQVANAPVQRQMRWRLGRRGAFLVLMGTLYLGLAYAYGFQEQPEYVFKQLSMPIKVAMFIGFNTPSDALTMWGFLWASAGATAIITAWWPPGRDAWGFVALWLFSAVWSVLNLWGGLVLDADRAGIVGLIFAIYAASVVIVSGFSDPSPISKVARDEP